MNLVTLSVQVEDLSQQTQVVLLQSATEKLAEATAAINAAASLLPAVTVESSNVARDIQQYKESSGISVKE